MLVYYKCCSKEAINLDYFIIFQNHLTREHLFSQDMYQTLIKANKQTKNKCHGTQWGKYNAKEIRKLMGHLDWNDGSCLDIPKLLVHPVPSPCNNSLSLVITSSPSLSLCWIRPFKSQLKSNFLQEAFPDTWRLYGAFLTLQTSSVLALTTLLTCFFIWRDRLNLVPYGNLAPLSRPCVWKWLTKIW